MPMKLQPTAADLAREAAKEQEATRQAQLRQQSQEQWNKYQQSLEQQKTALEAQRQADAAKLEDMISQRGTVKFDPETQPTLSTYYQGKREQEQVVREAAVVALRDSLTDRDIYMSMQSPAERKRIENWERTKGLKWPLPVGFSETVKAAKAE